MFILTNTSLTFFYQNKQHNVPRSHERWDAIVNAIGSNDYAKAYDIFVNDPKEKQIAQIVSAAPGFVFDVTNKQVYYDGEPLDDALSKRILEMNDLGLGLTAIENFIKNLRQNPDKSVIPRVFSFLDKGNMPITQDGMIVAWKKVRSDYTSVHDRTTMNAVGTWVEMPRERCNSNGAETCSTGLHFCSQAYLSHFSGERIVGLLINPKDVVSIPNDYNDSKGRACRYYISFELNNHQIKEATNEQLDVQPVVSIPEKSSLDGAFDVVSYNAILKAIRSKKSPKLAVSEAFARTPLFEEYVKQAREEIKGDKQPVVINNKLVFSEDVLSRVLKNKSGKKKATAGITNEDQLTYLATIELAQVVARLRFDKSVEEQIKFAKEQIKQQSFPSDILANAIKNLYVPA